MRKAVQPRFGLSGRCSPILFILCLLLVVERQAQAYVDPGSGAAYYQILLVGVVGLLFRVKRIATWFKTRKASSPSGNER